MEVSNEACYKLRNWLDAMSRKVAREKDLTKKKIENSKYIGGLKLISEAGGKVVYRPKHSHSVYFSRCKNKVIIKEFSTYQTIGALQMLNFAGFTTSRSNNILTIGEEVS